MLAIEAVSFRHTPDGPLYRFDIDVAPGEIVGLTGASGSGKSTLLDLIAGFLTPLSGDIALGGASLLGRPPETRPVSILFQTDNVFEHLSASANVALGLSNNARADDPAVRKALAQMGLETFSPRRAADLSGGQKQRVALARTLLRNKPVLLLDEPFTGLDEETAAPIRKAIADLVTANNWHAILVSHQKEDVAALASRRYEIRDGRTHPV
ncbi:ATP-binding cassette domain-containing protein [Pelagibacterium xiamenense]|uniref:ATP-binding cassette domain-containing protein n=1 Tax=Pelagibacterium xiamenense TaxID=2901140 RepID=UPI001E3419D5|nr:ATP-binding cassette domain-containing protein [Pelagibacterium xiamenense]MCD7060429.1 ATP-binding cassette domain-containing protein [Pelagibacterium xiamenense]